ncbi:MAG: YwaF family protein [Clostridia bacterium]|nr:YwaF family protein [Clostridia bacterium]
MNINKITDVALKALTAALLALALVLTFTVSDYYIFNRISFSGDEDSFNLLFVFSQWVKKAGYLLIPLAVFYKKKSCADIAKCFLPVFIIASLFTYGNFFEVTMLTESASSADKVYASINEFISPTANKVLFFLASAIELIICVLLFLRDSYNVSGKSFIYLPFAVIAVMPLNIFENFFDISNFSRDGFLWFKNFTLWHFLALAILVGFTIGAYYVLKRKTPQAQRDFLAAAAIVLLIQYHSKDSMVMGDGYNVYHTVFACIPLFICNIGVYVASLSVFLRKRVLYAISFFVHAAGALTVFIYFGKDDMSNYGIFCSYSILYFCLTHILLFALSVLPSALGHYKFKIKDCIIPLIYYCLVIVVAAVSSGLVSSASQGFTYDGYTLQGFGGWDDPNCEWLRPNYAFTQINPVPIPVPEIPITIWKCQLNILYLIILYLVYVGLFWAFTGGYYAFLRVRQLIENKRAVGAYNGELVSETAATEEDTSEENKE